MLAVTWITEVILELIHAKNLDSRRDAFIRPNQTASAVLLVTLNNFGLIALPSAGDNSYEGVPYQLSTVI